MPMANSLGWGRGQRWMLSALLGVLITAGCQTANPRASTFSDGKPNDLPKTEDPANPADPKVKRANHVEPISPQLAREIDPVLMDAEEFYRLQIYDRAATLFHKVADNTKNPPQVAERARFFEGESKYSLGDLVDAMSTYNRLLTDFSFGVYREQTVARMYEIANKWLEDTWKQIDAQREKEDGKRWFVPSNFIHFDKSKPTFDEESHALHMLEQVYYNDPTGPYADKALYLLGYVNFLRGHYREADQFLSELIQLEDRHGKRTKMRDQAWEMVIQAKKNCTGGPLYDGRKNAEALKIIQQAQSTSPQFATEKGEWVSRQIEEIRFQQAQKDFELGEYYRRTGKPASAWFYYELVRRRYQGTPMHDMAIAKMKDLQMELKQAQDPSFGAQASRVLTKAFLGKDPPTLEPGKEVPKIPGEVPEIPNSVIPVGGVDPQMIPKDNLPRQ